MKMIEAIIKPFTLESVKSMLLQIGIQGMTVIESRGFGRQRGHGLHYRGSEYTTDFVPKIKIQVVAPEALVPAVVKAILASARTGEIGDLTIL